MQNQDAGGRGEPSAGIFFARRRGISIGLGRYETALPTLRWYRFAQFDRPDMTDTVDPASDILRRR